MNQVLKNRHARGKVDSILSLSIETLADAHKSIRKRIEKKTVNML